VCGEKTVYGWSQGWLRSGRHECGTRRAARQLKTTGLITRRSYEEILQGESSTQTQKERVEEGKEREMPSCLPISTYAISSSADAADAADTDNTADTADTADPARAPQLTARGPLVAE